MNYCDVIYYKSAGITKPAQVCPLFEFEWPNSPPKPPPVRTSFIISCILRLTEQPSMALNLKMHNILCKDKNINQKCVLFARVRGVYMRRATHIAHTNTIRTVASPPYTCFSVELIAGAHRTAEMTIIMILLLLLRSSRRAKVLYIHRVCVT
jgi:hypothetical protein